VNDESPVCKGMVGATIKKMLSIVDQKNLEMLFDLVHKWAESSITTTTTTNTTHKSTSQATPTTTTTTTTTLGYVEEIWGASSEKAVADYHAEGLFSECEEWVEIENER